MMFGHYFILLLAPILSVHGHGGMVWPQPWQDEGGRIGLKEYGHMEMGRGQYNFYRDPAKTTSIEMFFTNSTRIPGRRTLPDYMLTMPKFPASSPQTQPWFAPGSAEVFSGCGVAGGNPYGCPRGAPRGPGEDCVTPHPTQPGVILTKGGFSYGRRAEDFPWRNIYTTTWRRGSLQDVAWGLNVNHGGGYSYRLCKMPSGGRSSLTERCFQRTPLNLEGDSWIQYGEDTSRNIYFKANRTTTGTYPPGSQWTKNPVPNCAKRGGGFFNPDRKCSESEGGYQFPYIGSLSDGVYGHGKNAQKSKAANFDWNIMDKVRVPRNIPTGEYVLSFRWDSEQVGQIWNTCSNIRIV